MQQVTGKLKLYQEKIDNDEEVTKSTTEVLQATFTSVKVKVHDCNMQKRWDKIT